MSQCDECGLVQQTVPPTDEALRIWYSHHYRRDYKSTIEPRPKHVRRAGLAALDRLRFLDAAAGPSRGRRLMDVGAGGGEFVYLASRSGYAARGLVPNVGYSDFARRHYDVDVRTAGIEQLAPGCADLVTMFHVLEHLDDPGAAFARIHAALADGGRVKPARRVRRMIAEARLGAAPPRALLDRLADGGSRPA